MSTEVPRKSLYAELKKILTGARREFFVEIQRRMREMRAEEEPESGQRDLGDLENTLHRDIQITVARMKVADLQRIEGALVRMEKGAYGKCFDCGKEVSERRLRAVPHALRCGDCEKEREAFEKKDHKGDLSRRSGVDYLRVM